MRRRDRRETARFVTPGSTTTRASSSSTDRIRRIRASTIRTPSAMRQRAAREPGAGAARDPRHPGLEARAHDLSDLGAARRKHRGERRLPVVRESVGAVRRERVRMRQHVLGAADALQAADQLGSRPCSSAQASIADRQWIGDRRVRLRLEDLRTRGCG